jgi:hypothetical protein
MAALALERALLVARRSAVAHVARSVPMLAAPLAPARFFSSEAGASATSSSSSSSGSSATSASARAAADVRRKVPQSLHLSDLRDNPGAKKRQRKKGRGVGGGHGLGRTAGEGAKGQKSHEGGGIKHAFEGGQSPLWRRTPKFGQMAKMFQEEMEPVNLSKLQLWIDSGRIDPSKCV